MFSDPGGWADLLSEPTGMAGPGSMLLPGRTPGSMLLPGRTPGSPTTSNPGKGTHRGLFFSPQGVPGEGDAGLQSLPVTPPPVGDKVLSLLNTPENFVGGRIHTSSHLWQALSSDTWIHGMVNGNVLRV